MKLIFHFFDGIYEKLLRKGEKSIYVVTLIRVFLTERDYSACHPTLTSVWENECFIPIMRFISKQYWDS